MLNEDDPVLARASAVGAAAVRAAAVKAAAVGAAAGGSWWTGIARVLVDALMVFEDFMLRRSITAVAMLPG